MKRFLILLAALIVAIPAAAKNPFVVYEPTATAFVDCAPADCAAAMARAEGWLAMNAPFRLSLATPNAIQTFGPLDSMPDAFAYTVVLEPTRIAITARCARVIWGKCAYDPAPAANLLWAELKREPTP